MPAESDMFRLGINYWPIRHAMAMWKHIDPTETAEDFARIAEGGFDCVRVFLLWEDFQPEPEAVSTARLEDLVGLADAAQAAGLALHPDPAHRGEDRFSAHDGRVDRPVGSDPPHGPEARTSTPPCPPGSSP